MLRRETTLHAILDPPLPLMVTYGEVSLYVSSHYTGLARNATMHRHSLLLSSEDYGEVRNAEDGRPLQVIISKEVGGHRRREQITDG